MDDDPDLSFFDEFDANVHSTSYGESRKRKAIFRVPQKKEKKSELEKKIEGSALIGSRGIVGNKNYYNEAAKRHHLSMMDSRHLTRKQATINTFYATKSPKDHVVAFDLGDDHLETETLVDVELENLAATHTSKEMVLAEEKLTEIMPIMVKIRNEGPTVELPKELKQYKTATDLRHAHPKKNGFDPDTWKPEPRHLELEPPFDLDEKDMAKESHEYKDLLRFRKLYLRKKYDKEIDKRTCPLLCHKLHLKYLKTVVGKIDSTICANLFTTPGRRHVAVLSTSVGGMEWKGVNILYMNG